MNNTTSNAIDTSIKQDHAKEQAAAQYSGICDMVAALNCDYDRLEELKDEKESLEYDLITSASAVLVDNVNDETVQNANDALCAMGKFETESEDELQQLISEAGDCSDQDSARTAIHEDPLSVEVRSGWVSYGSEMQAEEFRILLCTGGPAVRIIGELDNGQPCRAWMEYQDWGTGWTRFYDADQSVLLAYCSEFYFGDV
jgi:hypothetical protein